MRQRSRLVEDHRTNDGEFLERRGTSKENTHCCRTPRSDHHRNRCRKPESAWTRNDQHAHKRLKCALESNLDRRDQHPNSERCKRDDENHRNKDCRRAIGCARDLRLRRLSVIHQRNHAGEHRICRCTRRDHVERAERIHGSRENAIACTLNDRNRLARQHRLVDFALAADDFAIDRHPFSWSNSHAKTGLHLIRRDLTLYFNAIFKAKHAHGRNSKRTERANRVPRALRRTRLKQATEQHEDENDRSSFEPEMRRMPDVRGVGRDQRPHARRVSDRCTERNERVHVGAEDPRALERCAVDRPTAPKVDGRRERPLRPRGTFAREPWNRTMRHRDDRKRQRERRAHKEPPTKIS